MFKNENSIKEKQWTYYASQIYEPASIKLNQNKQTKPDHFTWKQDPGQIWSNVWIELYSFLNRCTDWIITNISTNILSLKFYQESILTISLQELQCESGTPLYIL